MNQSRKVEPEVLPPLPKDGGNVEAGPRRSRTPFTLALAIAVVADLVQIIFAPMFAEGALSPLNDVLDVVLFIVMTRLLGFHWAFLPTLVAEAIPGLNEFPGWTAAVLYLWWERRGPAA